MAKSVQGGSDDAVELSRPVATYLPSLGSRAPMFIKSTSPVSESMYTMGDASPELVNPPVTPWEDLEDEREFNPIRSPVNMLLATDLSEVGRSTTDSVPMQAATRWPYLKQHAARLVYGNLRSRLQSRERAGLPSAAQSLTYAPSTTEQALQLEGIQVQTLGIDKTKHQLSKYGNNTSKYRPLSTKESKTSEETIDYRVSLKSAEVESRGCVSAPPPTAEPAVKPDEAMTKTTHHRQRSKMAREFYRPKKGPHVKFDTSELPQKLQREPRLPVSPSPGGDLGVTWSDVVTAKSNGVYRNKPNGLNRRADAKDPRGVQEEQLYLSPELWGILDEDIGSIKKAAGKN